MVVQTQPFDPNANNRNGAHTNSASRTEAFDELSLCAKLKSKAQEAQIAFSKGEQCGVGEEPSGYCPIYYTKSYGQDPRKIEMSFDCTNYQHQFRLNHEAEIAPMPFEQHVFQSIFLDKTSRHLWTIDEIDESKIIERKWWYQLGHRWHHYVRVVPCMMFINGRNHTLFAGSWTLVVSLSMLDHLVMRRKR